ncbi:MAG TPA: carbohydrate porin [Desulfobacterales bacterium]|nr:carbohydrate porin [Desulfobacterales bacterium]
MKRCWMVLLALLFVAGTSGRAMADNATILKEIQSMKERIEELEQKLEEQESLAKRQVAKTEKNIEEKIGESLEERFGTLEIHGGAILYYQDSRTDELDDAKANSPSGAGFTADLELTWNPALPLVEDGKFYVRIHAGDGTGADRDGQPNNPVNVLLANLNTIADDNSGGNDTGLDLVEAHYTHEFFDKTLSVTGGKAKNLMFLDGNAFANNEKQQFVGKAFVNNSVLDSESEYTPLIGGEFKPTELLAFSVVGTSTSRPNVEGTPLETTAKSKYDNVFSTPFLGAQATVSPKFGELEGNYRVYGWWAGYDHSKLDRDRNPIDGRKAKGWGIGVSADQQITKMLGLFGRFGWNNDDVYVVGWEASGGVNLKGFIPGRSEDNLGVGFAALTPGDRYAQNDPEYHLEIYYRIAVTENLAFSPDIQYVWNPGGDGSNDGIFAGMLRGEFNF